MDERFYIVGALALVLALLAVYVLASIVRYRRAVRRARTPQALVDSEGEAKYLAEDDTIRAAFSAAPVVDEPVEPEEAVPTTVAVSEPIETEALDEPRHPASGPPSNADGGATAGLDELTRLMMSLEMPQAPAAAVTPTPEPAPAPAPAPVPRPVPLPEPIAARPVIAEPRTESAVPPKTQPLPGYSLADELERLMGAATAESTLLSPEAHERAAGPIAAPAPPEELAFEAPPIAPPLSVGQALSAPQESAPTPAPPAPVLTPQPAPAPQPPAPAPRPVAVVAPTPAPGAGTVPVTPRPAASVPSADLVDRVSAGPEYALVAPVELHFTGGQGRVGVKPGTRSYAEFQRLAGIMLGDLRAARER